MPTLANDVVAFLMSLFGNQEAAQEFLDNPERALDNAGLGEVCSADVDAAMPVVLDFAPINASSFDRSYNTGGNGAATGGGGGGAVAVTPPPSGGGHGDDDHDHAVQQLHNVVNNYSWSSSVDDRDTITDQSVNQNIWADGDVEQWFENTSVTASGDRAVAAGDDVDIEDSNNIEDSYNTDNSNDSSTNIRAGEDVNIGNEETDIDDSFNTDLDVDVDDSFNDNSDNSDNTDVDVEVADSFNDNSETTEVEIEDSFTQDSSINTDVEVDVEDSFQDNSDSNNIEDNIVVAENTLEFTDESTNTTVDADVDIDESFNEVVVEEVNL